MSQSQECMRAVTVWSLVGLAIDGEPFSPPYLLTLSPDSSSEIWMDPALVEDMGIKDK